MSICYNTSPGTLGIGGSVLAFASRGTINYQWQQNVNGLGWVNITGETESHFTPPNLTQNTQFRRISTNTQVNSGQSCLLSTNNINIQVESQIIPGNVIGSQTICYSSIPSSLQLTGATSGANINYEWQSSTDGVNFNDMGVTGNRLTFSMMS